MAYNCSIQLQSISRPFLDHKFLISKDVARSSLPFRFCEFTSQPLPIHRFASFKSYSSTTSLERRTAEYQPSPWSLEFLESIGKDRGMEIEKETIKNLEERVGRMFDDERLEPLALLELIDDIQGLGLGYLYEVKIERDLEKIYHSSEDIKQKIGKNIRASALYFKLLRQHGHEITTDIFESFMENGNFRTTLAADASGLLSLYEASHLAFDGETTLDKAREFASFHLSNMLGDLDTSTAERATLALGLPSHYRMHRLAARWNIETYDKDIQSNEYSELLHKLAHLDFNLVQSTQQRDLAELSRWWREIDLANKLSFTRDRLMGTFYWGVGLAFQPQNNNARKGVAKAFQLITVIDDIYDVYGLPEELQQFTDAVERWDISAIEDLPDYMKICFLALYNIVNDVAYDFLKERGIFIVPQLSKVWADLCKGFLKEAEWYYGKYTPSLDEYLNNGWLSASGAVMIVHAYLLMNNKEDLNEEVVRNIMDYPEVVRLACNIFRLTNDLSSSEAEIQRGETVNAISCYMQETGESEEVARAYIRNMVDQNWKKMNREMFHNSLLPKSFNEIACNVARVAECLYQYGDGHSNPDISINRMSSVIVEPIQLVN